MKAIDAIPLGLWPRAKDKPDWVPDEEWVPEYRSPAKGKLHSRDGHPREEALRKFLRGELRGARTSIEKELLAGLIVDVKGTLERIG